MARTTRNVKAETGTWLFGVLRSTERPDAARLPPGPPGLSPARFVEAGPSLWLAIADAPLAQYGEAAIASKLSDLDWVGERALGHDQVVQALVDLGTLLPARLFTLFASEARALDELRRTLPSVEETLRRLEGRDEWSLRLRRRGKPAAAPATTTIAKPASGRDFLARKQAVRQQAVATTEQIASASVDAQEALIGLSVEHVRKPVVAEGGSTVKLIADVALLAERDQRDTLLRTAKQHHEKLAALGVELELTGPWAAYHFAGAPR